MKKKVISILLVLAMFFGMLPAGLPALAAETEDGLVYKIEDGQVTITDYTGTATELVIQSEIEGYPVTSIGNNAFDSCSSLLGIVLPSSITIIKSGVFYNCSSLEGISIPPSVTSIGEGAFSNCSSLANITLPDGLTSIENGVFSGCNSLTSISIPEGVTTIGNYAFYSCWNIKSITIPANVTSIGDYAFASSGIKTFYFLGDAPTFGESVFTAGTGAVAYYPVENQTWTKEAVSNCFGGISWSPPPYSDVVVRDNIWYYIDIETGETSVEGIAEHATNVVIPEQVEGYPVTRIVERAFRDDNVVESIEIPGSVTSIGDYAFERCSNLTNIMLPANMTSIGNYVFTGCSNLTSIMIPASVTSIGDGAFENTALNTVYFYGNAPTIQENAFEGVTATAYYLASNNTWTEEVMQNYGGTITWKTFSNGVTISGNITSYDDDTATVTVELLDWAGNVTHTATATGNNAAYSIADIPYGDALYTLRVSKANHVTRSYEIMVGDTDLTQDITLLPVGDVANDGKVTATDYSRLLAHVKKTSNMTDEYLLLSADVTGDGKITATDYSRLLAHVKKVSLLW